MKLELKHLAPYLPYGLKYYPSEKSDLFHDCYANNNLATSWNYQTALENGDEFAIKLSKSYLIPNMPFIAIEDGELFLGQFTSSLGFDVDDIYAWEVKPILKPIYDFNNNIYKKYKTIYPNTNGFDIAYDIGLTSFSRVALNSVTEYCIIQLMIEELFDVFGLIKKGLAMDINTIENGKEEINTIR